MCYAETPTVTVVKAEEQCQAGATTIIEVHLDPEKAAKLVERLSDAGDGSILYSCEDFKVAR